MTYVVDSEFAMDDDPEARGEDSPVLILVSVDRMDVMGSVEGDKFQVVDVLVR